MTIETRKPQNGQKYSTLPVDYLKMVTDVFSTHFADSLKVLSKIKANPAFSAHGAVYPNEVLLSISLHCDGQISATTLHSSTDFDSKASSPTTEDLLAACVDALGEVTQTLFGDNTPTQVEVAASESFASLTEIPIEWQPVQAGKFTVYVMVDKSNPILEAAADRWLRENDPDEKASVEQEHEETEALFVTGKNKKNLH